MNKLAALLSAIVLSGCMHLDRRESKSGDDYATADYLVLADVADERQIVVLACESIIKNNPKGDIPLFVRLDDEERRALSSRLPKHTIQTLSSAELTFDRGYVGKRSRRAGAMVGAVVVKVEGRNAVARGAYSLGGLRVNYIFELRKDSVWQITKTEKLEILR